MACQAISLHLCGSALSGSPAHRRAEKKTPMRASPSGSAQVREGQVGRVDGDGQLFAGFPGGGSGEGLAVFERAA
jgi:hypothetical protein